MISDELWSSGWGRICGQVWAANLSKCVSIDGGRVIDFFIMDSRSAHTIVSTSSDLDLSSSVQSAVVLSLRDSVTSDLAVAMISSSAAYCLRTSVNH